MRYGREDRIRELQAEIDRLRAEQEAPPVWTPDFAEVYYATDSGEVLKYHFYHDSIDKTYLKVGNLFETKQEAEDYARALKLIETIRRERYKAQGHWWPSEYEARYTIYWDQCENCIDTVFVSWLLSAPAFGNWQDQNVLMGVVEKYDSELGWYFIDYLPSIN